VNKLLREDIRRNTRLSQVLTNDLFRRIVIHVRWMWYAVASSLKNNVPVL